MYIHDKSKVGNMAHISGMRIRIVGFAISYCVVCSFVIRAIDVVGFWSGYIVILGRTGSFELKITTEEKKLTCKIKMVNEPAKVINDLKIEKDTITFSLQTSAQDIPRLEFSGNIEGDKMKLTISGRDLLSLLTTSR